MFLLLDMFGFQSLQVCLKFNFGLLKLAGHWVTGTEHQDNNQRNTVLHWSYWAFLFYRIFILAITLIHFCSVIGGCLKNADKFKDQPIIGAMGMFAFQAFVKLIYTFIKAKKIRNVLETWDDTYTHASFVWSRLNTIESSTKVSKRVSLCLLSSYVLLAIQWCVAPMSVDITTMEEVKNSSFINTTVSSKALPFLAWFPFDVEKSPLYNFIFGFQIIASVYFVLIVAAFDAFFCALLSQAVGQLDHLKASLGFLIDVCIENEPLMKDKLKTAATASIEDLASEFTGSLYKRYLTTGSGRVRPIASPFSAVAPKNTNLLLMNRPNSKGFSTFTGGDYWEYMRTSMSYCIHHHQYLIR